jgi:hypothetical protein
MLLTYPNEDGNHDIAVHHQENGILAHGAFNISVTILMCFFAFCRDVKGQDVDSHNKA